MKPQIAACRFDSAAVVGIDALRTGTRKAIWTIRRSRSCNTSPEDLAAAEQELASAREPINKAIALMEDPGMPVEAHQELWSLSMRRHRAAEEHKAAARCRSVGTP